MSGRRISVVIGLLALAAIGLTACGQMGPLMLPETATETETESESDESERDDD